MTDRFEHRLAPSELSDLRERSFSIAYRMLGSVAEAEDVVQEILLRLHRAREEGTVVESPRAYVAAASTRLAIDHLRSARVRRESYVGPWLPEPIVDERNSEMSRHAEMAESLSMAFLAILETLSPIERAVFLLREVFDYGYDEISEIVEKSQDNCRQIFARARRHLDLGKPRFEASPEKREELARSFFEACKEGNKGKKIGTRLRCVSVNGQPGAMIFDAQARLINVIALDIVDGEVMSVRSVVNPDKLRHLGPLSDVSRLPQRG